MVLLSRYKNLILIFILILLLALSCATFYLYKSRPQIAFVQSLELVYGYNGMKDAHNKYKRQLSTWQANIDTLAHRYEVYKKELEQAAHKLSKTEKESRERLLARLKQDLQNYTTVIEEQSREEEKKLTQAVLNQVNSSVQQYAKEKGYDLVFGAEGTGTILYGARALDITEEVLTVLNQQYQLLPMDTD